MMATHPISRLNMSEPDFEAAFGRLLISPAEAGSNMQEPAADHCVGYLYVKTAGGFPIGEVPC